MRIIAGQAKGRSIKAPKEAKTRPTTDRCREAIFNSLYSLGAPEGCRVLDLFAGSGALGIEALSRGAEFVTFVDHDKDAIKTIHSNLSLLGFYDRAELIRLEAMEYLKSLEGDGDVVFLDPPFAFDDWQNLLSQLESFEVLVLGSDRDIEVSTQKWDTVKAAKYSSTYIKVCRQIK